MPSLAAPAVILSGAYVGPEMIAEFGNIPPSFLPVGIRRLFELQLDALAGRDVWLSLPDDFDVPAADAEILLKRNVTIIRCDPKLPLSAALCDVLRETGVTADVIVLHGDTVAAIKENDPADFFATAVTGHLASWAEYYATPGSSVRFDEKLGEGFSPRSIACGLFGFSDAARLRECASQGGGFDQVLTRYASDHVFTPVKAADWLDFGHLHTYYRSRETLLSARTFNSVKVTDGAVIKDGEPEKISAESRWYEQLPPAFKPFAPQLIYAKDDGVQGYSVEYLFLPSLAELFCLGELPAHVWNGVLGACGHFLELAQAHRPPDASVNDGLARRFFDDMYRGKTQERLERFAHAKGVDLRQGWRINGQAAPSLGSLSEQLLGNIRPTEAGDLSFWHGDFHFANILYDFRAQRIRCIDPRGMLSTGEPTIFGDRRYDVAKLCHSILGLYDLLVSGRYALDAKPYELSLTIRANRRQEAVQAIAGELRFGHARLRDPEILSIAALLFLAMAPLHSEDEQRQFAMVANAYRIAGLVEAAA